MSGNTEDGGEKSHEPTPHKLEEARKRGDVAKSDELTTVAVYLGLLTVGAAAGGTALVTAGGALSAFFAHADRLPGLGPGAQTAIGAITGEVLLALVPFFAVPGGLALASLLAQRAIAPSGEKIKPKLSKISPIANVKQKFGPTGLMDFAKRFVKLLVVSAVAFTILYAERNRIIGIAGAEAGAVAATMFELVTDLMIAVTIIAAAIAAVDVAWVHYDHRRKLRMTLKELKDETKESEGDPALKAKRRQRATDIATNRMLADVPTADVVVVNPTHVAVALSWDRTPGSAPRCVAKGADALAATIRELAESSGVPIHRDVPTARALFASVDIGEEIHPDHYAAVAVAIRFAEDLRRRARFSQGGPL